VFENLRQLSEPLFDPGSRRRLKVVAVQAVGHRDDPDAGDMELGEDREHDVVVAGEAGEIVDEDEVKGPVLAGP
jgi:hypothetical protein